MPVKQFMDCILPLPEVGKPEENCWGASEVGPRDQKNGLEDAAMEKWCYWDGLIMKHPESGKYYMFASRWDQSKGHVGWLDSQAVYSVSDALYGPYTDLGPLWPDWCEGAGHNVFPFPVGEKDPLYAEGYRYAIVISDTGRHRDVANGTIHLAKSIDGPWELMKNENGGRFTCDAEYALSNISIAVGPDGRYTAINRHGDIAVSDSLAGTWEHTVHKLWQRFEPMKDERMRYMEDAVIWYGHGLFNVVVNDWEARNAYYLTSEDGLDWKLYPGSAYTPTADFIRYEDGTVNRWTKLERPSVYVEDNEVKAITLAVIDVQKEDSLGSDGHGSKILVLPFSAEGLQELISEN